MITCGKIAVLAYSINTWHFACPKQIMEHKMIKFIVIVIAMLGMGTSYLEAKTSLATVPKVELNRYLGLWHQFAYFPNSFQPKNCGATTAKYSLRKNGSIEVHNICYEDAARSKIKKQARGKATIVNGSNNAKLKVSFFWPFSGDYWIIDLDEKDYSYAVVSEPKRRYLWILTRKPNLEKATYDQIIAKLRANGFDLKRLELTGSIVD